MNITIRYFASVREAMGCASESWQTQASTLEELRAELMARGGDGAASLAPGKAVRMAVNQIMCQPDALLSEGAEVAFFPPVTGG